MFEQPQTGDALVIVDVQKDFCPGGPLAVDSGDAVVPVLNDWIARARSAGIPVIATRDWHPVGHLSFDERGGPWPPHCIQDSDGARFHPDLELPAKTVKVTKGVRFDQDQYSAFDQTGLASQLEHLNVRRLWLGGLAEDVCVLKTSLDARKHGLDVKLIAAATKPLSQEGGEKAREQMKAAGIERLE